MITNKYLKICQRYSELHVRKELEDIYKFIVQLNIFTLIFHVHLYFCIFYFFYRQFVGDSYEEWVYMHLEQHSISLAITLLHYQYQYHWC